MYAIIRKSDGQYYTSMVFAYFDKARGKYDYHHCYWTVLNEEKTKLVNQMTCGEHDIKPRVLTVDSDQQDWNTDDDNCQVVNYLPKDTLYEMIESDAVPEELFRRCIEADRAYTFLEYP